jgi:hypothetical protein
LLLVQLRIAELIKPDRIRMPRSTGSVPANGSSIEREWTKPPWLFPVIRKETAALYPAGRWQVWIYVVLAGNTSGNALPT